MTTYLWSQGVWFRNIFHLNYMGYYFVYYNKTYGYGYFVSFNLSKILKSKYTIKLLRYLRFLSSFPTTTDHEVSHKFVGSLTVINFTKYELAPAYHILMIWHIGERFLKK